MRSPPLIGGADGSERLRTFIRAQNRSGMLTEMAKLTGNARHFGCDLPALRNDGSFLFVQEKKLLVTDLEQINTGR